MTLQKIADSVTKLKNKYGETDPFRLCKDLGIKILYSPMGTHEGACKGFYMECKRIKTITINSDLPKIIQRIIAAHELGHALHHRNPSTVHAFHEISMFDETTVYEKEANLFAAELLLDDQAVIDALNCDVSFFGAASLLCVPAELLDFKFRVMKWKGYKITDTPLVSDSNFLKDIYVPANYDNHIC